MACSPEALLVPLFPVTASCHFVSNAYTDLSFQTLVEAVVIYGQALTSLFPCSMCSSQAALNFSDYF